MARSLRSNSRCQKLHLQHIQQVNQILRVKLNDRINTKNDNFEQTEFLSLFGLTPNYQPKISKCRAKNGFLSPKRKRPISRQIDGKISHNESSIQSKLRKTLGKPIYIEICIPSYSNHFNRWNVASIIESHNFTDFCCCISGFSLIQKRISNPISTCRHNCWQEDDPY